MQTDSSVTQVIMQRLDAFAEKLGTTAQYLWGSLLRQARVEAIEDVLFVLFSGLSVYVCVRLTRAIFHNEAQKDEYRKWDNPLAGLALVIFVVGIVVSAIVGMSCLQDAITAAANPDYWALQRLLSIMK